MKKNVPNGLQCPIPTCGRELVDSNPLLLLESNPPKTYVRCLNCGYTGTRKVED